MPVGTRKMDTVRRELRTCPPDGYVVLRQLSFDEMLERRDGATKVLMERGVGGRNADAKMAVQIANKWSNHFSFPRCIVEHNITDDSGTLLDFSERTIESIFRMLDPKIGAEMERLIDELNQEEEEPEDFMNVPSPASQDGETPLLEPLAAN